VTDEAEAVLAILTKKNANQTITEADWQRLFLSEGYVRLKNREASMKRAFEAWRRADISRSAQLALAYLPGDAHITAKIYPVIKPRENSFVFEVRSDP